jgi:hypothetical protein
MIVYTLVLLKEFFIDLQALEYSMMPGLHKLSRAFEYTDLQGSLINHHELYRQPEYLLVDVGLAVVAVAVR